jgi:hypothetical protein
MVQIEELGKVIARIVAHRDSGAARHIPQQLQVVYDSLKLDNNFLLTAWPEDIRTHLDSEDSGGILRMGIAIKVLIEESFLYTGEERRKRLLRAKELLEYLQQTDTTFSFERINQLNEIGQWLKES